MDAGLTLRPLQPSSAAILRRLHRKAFFLLRCNTGPAFAGDFNHPFAPRSCTVNQILSRVALLVHDYDDAIRYFTQALGFSLIEDAPRTPGKRWVVVAPPGTGQAGLLLARAVNDEQRAAVGRQGGGRVFLFLETDDFDRDFAALEARGVRFIERPRDEEYGRVVVFEDLYGNRWDLIGRHRMAGGATGTVQGRQASADP